MAIKINRIANKLLLVCLSFVLPIAVMLYLMIGAKAKDIDFAKEEMVGDAYQRPLEKLLKSFSEHRLISLRIANGETNLDPQFQQLNATIESQVQELVTVNAQLGVELQFTEEGLGKRKRTEFTVENLIKAWNLLKVKPAADIGNDEAHTKIIAHLRTMITHMGDTSNLILDPDLDSYYFMDVTLLALPQTQDRVQEVLAFGEKVFKQGNISPQERIQASVYAAFLKEADLDRINGSTQTSLNEDANFYGVSESLQKNIPPLIEHNTKTMEAFISSVKHLSEVEPIQSFNINEFRNLGKDTIDSLYNFHQIAFDEEDQLLRNRMQDIEGDKTRAILMTSISLLISAILAYFITRSIIIRVKRVIGVTRTIANGDLEARVNMPPGDEVSELATSFDNMTQKVVHLGDEIEKKNLELQDINHNLESLVADRTATIKTILDNVKFGFLLIDKNLKVLDGYSKSCIDLLGNDLEVGKNFLDIFKLRNDRNAILISEFLQQAFDDFLPEEMTLRQIPQRVQMDHKTLSLQACVVRTPAGAVNSLLFTIIDATGLQKAEKEGARQALLVRLLKETEVFRDFLDESKTRIAMCHNFLKHQQQSKIRNELHTIKGNSAAFDLNDIAKLVHAIEEAPVITEDNILAIENELRSFLDENYDVLQVSYDDMSEEAIHITPTNIENMLSRLNGLPNQNLYQEVLNWASEVKYKPAKILIGAIPTYATRLAQRLGKKVEVAISGEDIRMDPETMRTITQSLVHLVRNSIDHGIEEPLDREGKAEVGKIIIDCSEDPKNWIIKIIDDGKGIDTSKVLKSAIKAGFIQENEALKLTEKEKCKLIFMSGVSTSTTVTDISGRGVGMNAVESAVKEAGGFIDVESKLAKGTTITIQVPKPTTVPSKKVA